MPRAGSGAHASISGRTTSPPEVSPSHHVRQNVVTSDRSMTPPASIDTVPTVALISGGDRERDDHAADLLDSIEGRAGADQPAEQQGPTMISAMLPACWPTRLPNGSAWLSSSSSPLTITSPMKIPGHQRRPQR